jgi:hypothetical protein
MRRVIGKGDYCPPAELRFAIGMQGGRFLSTTVLPFRWSRDLGEAALFPTRHAALDFVVDNWQDHRRYHALAVRATESLRSKEN